jgi:hypothetical protein
LNNKCRWGVITSPTRGEFYHILSICQASSLLYSHIAEPNCFSNLGLTLIAWVIYLCMSKVIVSKPSNLLSPGNTKTGNLPGFDIPAKTTCPGKTNGVGGCASKCYAYNMSRVWPAVGKKYWRNYRESKKDSFVPQMVKAIPYSCTFRIHVSGDFYSRDYVFKWIDIASKRLDVQFFFYTRSWTDRSIWHALRIFAALPNVSMNISCDKVTGKPYKTCETYKWCYLTFDDTAPKWLRQTDLIFRDRGRYDKRKRHNAIKKGIDPNTVAQLVHNINEVPVCPLERGASLDLQCSRCRICFTFGDKGVQ